MTERTPEVPGSGATPNGVTLLGDFSRKLVTNTFFNVLGRSWSFLLTLLLTPFVLHHLPVGQFGTWVLLSVFVNWFNLLDLGLGFSFVKFISEFYTRQDYERVNRTIFSGLVFYLVFGLALILAGLAAYPFASAVLALPHDPAVVYGLVLASFAVNNVAAMFLSVIRGVQRMDKSNSIEIRMGVTNAVGTVVFLESGYGLTGLAANALIQAVLLLALSWWTVRRIVPEVRLSWRPDPQLLREMFGYGAKIQVSRLGGLVCFQMDKLILSAFLGLNWVGFYEVSSRLASFMRSVPLVMISALIPATSELDARNDRDKILKTYFLASRYVAMLTVALMGFLILEAGTVVRLWLGPGFEESVVLVQILAVGYGINVMGGAASQTGAGVGRPDFDMKGTVLLILLNPLLSLLLVREFGAAGAALGTSLAMAAAAGYLVVLFQRGYVQSPAWSTAQDIYLRPLLAGALAVLSVAGFHQLIPAVPLLDSPSRLTATLKMGIDGVIFGVVYFVLLVALRQVTRIDRNNMASLISFGFEFLRHPFRQRVKIYR